MDSVTRLCAMNLLLHGIGSEADGQTLESGLSVVTKDALAAKHGEYDIDSHLPICSPFGLSSISLASPRLDCPGHCHARKRN